MRHIMAQEIQDITGADIFRIEPEVPYPAEYALCTEVALEEKRQCASRDKGQSAELE